MAELCRFSVVKDSDGDWVPPGRGSRLNIVFFGEELRNQVHLPEETRAVDIVAYSRPGRNRFEAVVLSPVSMRVEAYDCEGALGWFSFPFASQLSDWTRRHLEKANLKKGETVYLQVEYD